MDNEKQNVGKICLRKRKKLEHWQIISFYLMAYDVVVAAGSYFAGLWLRYDLKFTQIPRHYLEAFAFFVPIYAVAVVGVHWYNRLYKSIWRFASYTELKYVTLATIELTALHTLLIAHLPQNAHILLSCGTSAAIHVCHWHSFLLQIYSAGA